jgi:SAM-dependent methyltransferase
VDWSGAGLEMLAARARAEGTPIRRISSAEQIVKRHHGGIDLVQADLEQLQLPENTFGLILCIQYLQRSLFRQLQRALRAGGVLLFETFTQAQLEFQGGPRNPEYLLKPGELGNAFPELRVLFYRELRAGQGIASLMAQKPQNRDGSNITIQWPEVPARNLQSANTKRILKTGHENSARAVQSYRRRLRRKFGSYPEPCGAS